MGISIKNVRSKRAENLIPEFTVVNEDFKFDSTTQRLSFYRCPYVKYISGKDENTMNNTIAQL